jgi:acyl-CoA dehydrogenase
MDFELSAEQRMILDTVRAFVQKEVMPLEAEIQRAELEGRQFPDRPTIRKLQAAARTAGLWGLLTPEEYGGANLGYLMTALITMETARALVPFIYGGHADNILYQCTPAQRERYLLPTIEGERQSCFALTEPDTGSDATNIKMPAIRDGTDWVLNGQKVFITNGCEADFAIVFAVTDPSKGYKGGVTAFLVDRAMGWTSRRIQTMGSWGPAELHFDNVRVPAENVLGELGNGFGLAMAWIGQGRLLIPARAVGQAQRLLEMGREYARQRIAFGHPIADYQAIQWMLADSAVEIEEVGWLVLSAAWRADQAGDARHAISMAKLAGAEMIWRVADRVLQIHGGTGYTKELPIERVMRDVRVYRIYEGTDEIQRRSIARNLLERGARIGSWT